ncbi:hypothetical protein A8B78_05130 [Jannaschia sp. EhC01]|nr:hypothetical protein A8B78_05130 [Jannaschia sp. EhC01]
MTGQVLLLRGINVGGHGKLPMAVLRGLLNGLGADGAQTHLQSGNAVCPQRVDAATLADQIDAAHGFRPTIMAIDDWPARAATPPLPTDVPKALHGFFHDGPPLDTAAMLAHLSSSERLHAARGVLWLHTPEGFGRSRIATRLERLAGRPVTARNWNTVAAISGMVAALQTP